MEKKEHIQTKAETMETAASCNCGPECTCGCQEGKECHCHHCSCGCGGCPCQKKAAKLLVAIIIFALGFVSAKLMGCRPCLMGHKPCPKMGMQAPQMPQFGEGTGNTIIIINTDGKPDIKHILDNNHGKKPHFPKMKHHKNKHKMMPNDGAENAKPDANLAD